MRTRRCATGEQQPCYLGVMEGGEVVEEAALAGKGGTQVGLDELRSAKRNTKGNNTTLCHGSFLATNPDRGVRGKGKHTWWTGGRVPAEFQTFVLAALRRRRAFRRSPARHDPMPGTG